MLAQGGIGLLLKLGTESRKLGIGNARRPTRARPTGQRQPSFTTDQLSSDGWLADAERASHIGQFRSAIYGRKHALAEVD